MLLLGRAKHRPAFELLVDGVLLGHAHRSERLSTVGVGQGDAISDPNRLRDSRIDRQRNRNGPEDARRHAVVPTHALPVGVAHESIERRKAADAEHDDVALFARAHGDFAQRCGARSLGDKRLALQHERLESASAVRRDEIGHLIQPGSLALRAKSGTRIPASHTRANCRKVATTLEWNLSFG